MRKNISKIFAMLLTLIMMVSLTACGGDSSEGKDDKLKIGVILVGDENEGYTYAHIEGIKAAMKALNISDDQVVWKYSIPEDETCFDTAVDLADSGCDIIFSNSYSHQSYMVQAAEKYPDVTFCPATGDTAAVCGLDNVKNYFTAVYESRYVSGVVAGMKLKELLDSGKVKEPKIGYVGAYPYAEVVSGYTAFYLGIKSMVPEAVMEVTYTSSWFDIAKEGEAANKLISDGCVIIGQHADSTGAPAAIQAALDSGKVVYSVGYNVDMLSVAPDAALTSATNVWEVYYEYALNAALKGEEIKTDWCEGYNEGAVAITELGKSCAEGTEEKVEEVIAAIKDGSLHVFDTSTFTVDGKTKDSYKFDFSTMNSTFTEVLYEGPTEETISDGYFHESEFRSAPYFDLRIDGITELN
ncbi:MAG: BMP family ABC transporter substrate-binding protein [Clostridiaceae bacterium]